MPIPPSKPERRGGARKKSAPAACVDCGATPATHVVATGDYTAKGPLCAKCAKKYGAKV